MNDSGERLRPLGLPRPVEVRLDSEGRPNHLRLPGRPARRIVAVSECWRVDDGWWREPVSREYHSVILDGGGRVAIYEDLLTGKWYRQR